MDLGGRVEEPLSVQAAYKEAAEKAAAKNKKPPRLVCR